MDATKDELVVEACNVKIINTKLTESLPNQTTIHKIGETESRYGLLLLGAKSPVGSQLPTAKEVTIVINGQRYDGKKPVYTHKTTQGRIDGLTQLFKLYPEELAVGARLSVSYDSSTETLSLKSI